MKRVLWGIVVVLVAAGSLAAPRVGFAPVSAADDPDLLSMPGLTAVAIVGPIDGDTGEWTLREIDHMELAADVLEAQGVTVHRFYTPNNDWDAIVAAASGAHFLLYRGHGPAWSERPDVGGFMLEDRMVTPAEVATDLHLAPGAIVMLYACYSAGSGAADTGDIGIAEARRRVLQYSDAFVSAGAAGYYANWYGDAFEHFLRDLFAGQTLGEAYEGFYDFNPDTVRRYEHPDDPAAVAWIDKDDWHGYWQYNNAFVGHAGATLPELFAGAELGGVPERLHFTYSLAEARYLVPAYTITPRNLASTMALPWSLTVDDLWVSTTALSGVTPTQSFTVSPNVSIFGGVGTYTGTVTVFCPTTGQSLDIALTLEVVGPSFSRTYLPVTLAATR